MRRYRSVLLAALCLASAAALAQSPSPLDLDALQKDTTAAGLDIPEEPAPEPRGVGYHEQVAAFHDREITYKLFVPEAYADPPNADVQFPLLVVQNPGGKPDIKQYMDWAQAHDVVLVGINKVSNGMKQHLKPRYQNGVFKDLDAIGLRIHPHLKYTIGMSGGSADGERFTRHSPRKFAGVVLQGAGRIPADEKRRHLAVAVLFGTLDDWVNVAKVNEQVAEARGQGQDVMLKLYPKMGHEWAPLADQQAALTWMLRTTKLTNPYLSDEEKAEYREQMLEQIQAAAQIEDPTVRMDTTEQWFGVLPLRSEPKVDPRMTALALSAYQGLLQRLESMDDPIARLELLLQVGGSSYMAYIPMEQRIDVMQRFEAERDQPAVESHYQHWLAFNQARRTETHAGRDVELLRVAIGQYQQLAADAADTVWAERAAAEIAPLEKWIAKNPDGGGIN